MLQYDPPQTVATGFKPAKYQVSGTQSAITILVINLRKGGYDLTPSFLRTDGESENRVSVYEITITGGKAETDGAALRAFCEEKKGNAVLKEILTANP